MPTVSYLTLVTGIPQKDQMAKRENKERRTRLQDWDKIPIHYKPHTSCSLSAFRCSIPMHLSTPLRPLITPLLPLPTTPITLHFCISSSHHLQSIPFTFPSLLVTHQPCTTTSRVPTWTRVYLLTCESFNWELNGHQRVLFSLEKLQFLVKAWSFKFETLKLKFQVWRWSLLFMSEIKDMKTWQWR